MRTLSVLALLTCLVSFATVGSVTLAEQSQSADETTVFRLDPRVKPATLVPVQPSEIKPGLAYNYYHAGLQRRVWGFATKDGSFEYAFGEGTILPTNRFDLQLSSESQSQILAERAPGLERSLQSVGRLPAVQLNAEGRWELLPFPSSERVFDETSGERWEWHGKRRLAVLHTGGNLWHVVGGRYYPMTVVSTVCP